MAVAVLCFAFNDPPSHGDGTTEEKTMTEGIEINNQGRSADYSATRPAREHETVCSAPGCRAAAWSGSLCHNHQDRVKVLTGEVLGREKRKRVNPRKLTSAEIERVLERFLGSFGDDVCCPRSRVQGNATRRDCFVLFIQHGGQWTQKHQLMLLAHADGAKQKRIEQMASTISAQEARIEELERIIESLKSGLEIHPNGGWDHDSEYDYSHAGFQRAREEAFDRSDRVCQGCGFEAATDGHHWERPGEYTEPAELDGRHLTALCHECHALITSERRRKSSSAIGSNGGPLPVDVDAVLCQIGNVDMQVYGNTETQMHRDTDSRVEAEPRLQPLDLEP